MSTMPKTSAIALHKVIQKLNRNMAQLVVSGMHIAAEIEEVDYSSVAAPSEIEDLQLDFKTIRETFNKINRMKLILMDGLRQKITEDTRSLSIPRKSPRRKTRRIRSI